MNTRTILIVAVAAAVLGAIAGLMVSGPGPLWRSRFGQQVLQDAMGAKAPPPPAGVVVAKRGEPMPPLLLPDLAGRAVAVPEAWAGRPVVVNLWATWCAPCVAELPTLDALAASHAADQRVLTVSQDMSGTEKVAEFLKARGGTRLEPWLDPKNDLAFHYQVTTLPTTILYDAKGREVWRYVGGHDWSGPDAAALIAQAR